MLKYTKSIKTVQIVKEHLKNNFAVYSVIIACVIVLLRAVKITSKPKRETVFFRRAVS